MVLPDVLRGLLVAERVSKDEHLSTITRTGFVVCFHSTFSVIDLSA